MGQLIQGEIIETWPRQWDYRNIQAVDEEDFVRDCRWDEEEGTHG